MHDILKQEIYDIEQLLENDVSDSIFSEVRLYQNYASGISPDFDELKYLASREVEKCKKALTYGEEYWKQLVDKYLNENYVVLYAIPSRTLIEKEKMEEDERLKKQVEELGPEGLKRCAEILERAVAANKASEASTEVLDKYVENNLTDFTVIPVRRFLMNDKTTYLTAPIIIHKIESNIIKVRLAFDIEDIPKDLYPFIKLFIVLLGNSSAVIGGEFVSCEKLLAKRKTELLEFNIYYRSNQVTLNIVSTLQNVSKIPFWIDTYLNKVVFEKSLLRITLMAMKMNDLQERNDDSKLLKALCNSLVIVPDTLDYWSQTTASQSFYLSILLCLNDDEFVVTVIQKLTEFKEQLSKAKVNLHVIGNQEAINELHFDSWPTLFGDYVMIEHPEKVQDYSRGAGETYCISRPECTSAYFMQFVKAALDLKSPEYIYLTLLNFYFIRSSNIVYNEIIGKGFASDCTLRIHRNIGLELEITAASNLPRAYEVVKKHIYETIVLGKLDPGLFKDAKWQVIKYYMDRENTISQAGENSYIYHMNGLNFDENEIQLIITLTKEATPDNVLKSVGRIYLDLFDDSKCGKVMVIPTTAEENIKRVFPHVEFKTIDAFGKIIDKEPTAEIDEPITNHILNGALNLFKGTITSLFQFR